MMNANPFSLYRSWVSMFQDSVYIFLSEHWFCEVRGKQKGARGVRLGLREVQAGMSRVLVESQVFY